MPVCTVSMYVYAYIYYIHTVYMYLYTYSMNECTVYMFVCRLYVLLSTLNKLTVVFGDSFFTGLRV